MELLRIALVSITSPSTATISVMIPVPTPSAMMTATATPFAPLDHATAVNIHLCETRITVLHKLFHGQLTILAGAKPVQEAQHTIIEHLLAQCVTVGLVDHAVLVTVPARKPLRRTIL